MSYLVSRFSQKMAVALSVLVMAVFAPTLIAEDNKVTISHYFTGEFGQKTLNEIMQTFAQETGVKMVDSPVGHEDFKTDILVRAAGRSLPDVFSYWAGARVQFLVDSGSLLPVDNMWGKEKLDRVVARSVAEGATLYNGKRYLAPVQYHYAGMFYNRKVFADAGIEKLPENWKEFLAVAKELKSKGITPIALGSKDRWPAQFWFDYLLLRTAGPEYRARLMNGQASYNDREVKEAMALWKLLTDKKYFVANANAHGWTDAADQVARGDAAMTLMGTWITGYWNNLELKPGVDYDFFPFPVITAGVPDAVVGPAEGFVISANAKNVEGAEKFLAYMASNIEAQTKWTKAAGALTANVNVDPSNYNEVIQRAFRTVAEADTFAFNYDLATPPPVAEIGLSMFARFMDDPSKVNTILEQVASDAKAAFKE